SAFLPTIMAASVVLWLIGFDIIYAIQDFEFDRDHKLHSLVVRWGPDNALTASLLMHMLLLALLTLFGLFAAFKMSYWIGLIIISACVLLEHWIARKRSLDWVQRAFF
ncbi:MAG: UbiA family prenyltransferase, partial [Verrucomicrobiia bacterium]